MAEKFIIKGGKPLKGKIEARGAKNAAFPILAATLLTKENCQISNIPLIEDVFRMIEILESIGARVSWPSKRTVKIESDVIPDTLPDYPGNWQCTYCQFKEICKTAGQNELNWNTFKNKIEAKEN